MGLFDGQLANVIEWQEYNENTIFWKWSNREIKKGSKLIIRPGQDAIFLYNGKIEGVFTDEGSFDVESDIIPFLSTLKGFRFGFNSGIRAEVLFVNTKEFTVKWGTKNAISVPAQGLPGGMPIRAFGTFNCKVSDYFAMIDKIAGVKQVYDAAQVKERVTAVLDQLLMKWIMAEGKNMFDLQASAAEISKGIQEDLDMEMLKIGISITGFNIQSFSYPEEVQKMQKKAAAQAMIGDMNLYQNVAMADSMNVPGSAGNMAANMAGMQMGMMMGQQMTDQLKAGQQAASVPSGGFNFCPNCGTKNNGANFCPNCGQKLV